MELKRTIHPSSVKFYDRLYFLYPLVDLFLKPHKKKFFDRINSYPHGRLLEIGVGNGESLKYYTKHAITGIDTSRAMLNNAMRYRKANIHLLQMNGESLVFRNNTFDYVALSHVISVVDDPQRVMEEIYRVLKPGGKVFILNHFTPLNGLRHMDKIFSLISPILRFKSLFHTTSLGKMEKFKLLFESPDGPVTYFKILIYEKTV